MKEKDRSVTGRCRRCFLFLFLMWSVNDATEKDRSLLGLGHASAEDGPWKLPQLDGQLLAGFIHKPIRKDAEGDPCVICLENQPRFAQAGCNHFRHLVCSACMDLTVQAANKKCKAVTQDSVCVSSEGICAECMEATNKTRGKWNVRRFLFALGRLLASIALV